MGEVTPVHIYTSGDAVELFLNGKSLGRKEKAHSYDRLVWEDVRYEPGTLPLPIKMEKDGRKISLRPQANRLLCR